MSDLKFISRHAGTVLVGQLAVMAFGVTDTIVAGRYSDTALATLSIATSVYISIFVGLMGVLQSLLPVWAELHGAGQRKEIGRSFRQALYLCGITIALGMYLLLSPGALLRWTQVPQELQVEATRYLNVLAMALPPALLFRMYSTLNQGLGKPLLVTMLQIGALFVKIPLSVWFVFGGWGLDAQGAVGCAWATLVVNYVLLGLALCLLRSHPLYRPLGIWRAMEAPRWGQIGEFARLGIPGGLSILVEVTSFTLMALFIARLGVTATASHQIASNLTAVMYMVPLSIAIAASARVSYWRGAGNTGQALQAIRLGFFMVAGTSLALSILIFSTRGFLISIYSANPDVIAMTLPLMGWVVVFHLFDALQASCVFFLRCFRVVVAPLTVYCVMLWGGGLGGGYLLAYQGLFSWPAQQNAAAFWLASTVALGITAAALSFILAYVTRQELRQT